MNTDAVGGVWIYATELAQALVRDDCKVTLVVMGPAPRRDQLEALRDVQGLDIEVTDLALEWMEPDGADVPRARQTLLSIADRVQPDLIHLNSYREARLDWPAPVLVVAHSCVSTWWQACRGGLPSEPCWARYAAAVKAGLAAADSWIAPTAAFRDAIDALYKPRTEGYVIWNGIGAPNSEAPEQPFILAAGRLWDEAKNLTGLAAIAGDLDWPVRVAGPIGGPGTRAHGPVPSNIECVGVLAHSEVLAQMRRAGIFASPALYEPFGLSVLEAAASGCALVLSDIPTFRELWNGAALFVDPRDNDALLDALQLLSRDEGSRARLQRAAQRRARRYSAGRMAHAYRDLYAKMQLPPIAPAAWPSATPLELRG